MGTTTRLCLGVLLLGALGIGLFLFVSGRISFPARAPARSATSAPVQDVPPVQAGRSASSGWNGSLPAPWIAPPDAAASQRFVSQNGRHALIVSRSPSVFDGVVDARPGYILLRRPDGKPAIPWNWWSIPKASRAESPVPMDALVEAGDEVLARGHLPFGSGRMHVLDEGGFVLVDYSGAASSLLTRYDASGREQWQRTSESLFGAAWIRKFPTPWSYGFDAALPWQQGTWVDEARGLLVLVTWEDSVMTLALSDGSKVPQADDISVVTDRIRNVEAVERVAALDLARRRGWQQAVDPARAVLADAAAPETARLHAALLLADHGDFSGKDTVVAITRRPPLASDSHGGVVEMAWRNLGLFLGEAAIPLYVERLREPLPGAHFDSVDGEVAGLGALGDAAILPAVDLLLSVPCDLGLSYHYACLLGRLRAGMSRDERHWPSGAQPLDEEGPLWDRFRTDGHPEDLTAILALQRRGKREPMWSLLVLPAARWARLHPRPEYADPLGTFREAFAVEPQCRDAWRDRVLAEVDAAIAACGGS